MISTTIGSDKPMSKTDGPACRELLGDIRRQTYLLEDQPGILREVRDQLRELQAKLYHAIPKEKEFLFAMNEQQQKSQMQSQKLSCTAGKKEKTKVCRKSWGEKREN